MAYNEYMTKKASGIPATRADIDELIAIMRDHMHFTSERFSDLENEIIDLKASLDRLTNTVDAIMARIDSHETEMAARDAQFKRLLSWAKKVSKQTGIPLEGF